MEVLSQYYMYLETALYMYYRPNGLCVVQHMVGRKVSQFNPLGLYYHCLKISMKVIWISGYLYSKIVQNISTYLYFQWLPENSNWEFSMAHRIQIEFSEAHGIQIWISSGCHRIQIWISSGCHRILIWISSGCHRIQIWISSGCHRIQIWISSGCQWHCHRILICWHYSILICGQDIFQKSNLVMMLIVVTVSCMLSFPLVLGISRCLPWCRD
jgi:hypothetical protein